MDYCEIHRRSIEDREGFWGEQARLIHWHRAPDQILDDSRLPFVRWFVGGQTNLCHNAVDRWLATHADQPALIHVSTEVDREETFTFAQLSRRIQVMAAAMQSLGVERGDRVLIYLPMIPEAAFAMLACARIGAIHSVVFGGFAAVSLASRIDDATPKLVISADAGSRAGKVMPYKALLDEAIELATSKPAHVLMVDRGLAPAAVVAGRDHDYAALAARYADAEVPVTWLESNEPSYILYTSGTTGKPKGVQRDVGGYAVALAASMQQIFRGSAGETFFTTSDIGWVVGHSYIIYGPLIAGMATIMYEGTPVRPDGGILWALVERYRVSVMFSAPTAIRVLKRQDPALLKRHDTSSLKALFLAGEPLDEPTARWIAEGLSRPVIDNYWQTESGWPILSVANGFPEVEEVPTRFGSPGFAMVGYDVQIVDEITGEPLDADRKGVVAIVPPLPPGCMQTVWRDDQRFLDTYFKSIPGKLLYSTFDWGIRDADGYHFILGRTDDVINVAGHRLGTREIEESLSSHSAVAECAVIGVADQLKGQVAMAFVVLRDAHAFSPQRYADGQALAQARLALEGELMKTVDRQLGALARPTRVHFVQALPKTRSGKVVRRSIQAICEQRDPGDISTIEDAAALDQVRLALAGLMLSFELKGLLAPWLLPPVSLFLLVAAAVIVARWWPRTGSWLAMVGAFLGVASTLPAVANRLIAWVEAPYAALDPPPLRLPQARLAALQATPERQPQAIVLLAGGVAGDGMASIVPNRPTATSLERIVHASRLARLTGLPLLVSGGSSREGGESEASLLKGVLEEDLSTPVRWTETGSRDTSENAMFTAGVLQPLGIRRILLVTHAYHMGRAESAFRRSGFVVTPAPHSFHSYSRGLTPPQFLPSLGAVSASHLAAREIIGQAWYRLNPPTHLPATTP